MINVGVVGAAGRMGSETCRAIEHDPETSLVARIGREDPLDELVRAEAAVAVDFTVPEAVKENVRFCLSNGIHVVVGTTGLEAGDLSEIEEWAAAGEANAVVAPNFARGAVVMMQLARRAAGLFDRVEIVERHHDEKRDAPSGTALRTAALINEARLGGWPAAADDSESLLGSRGGDAGDIRIHSLRVPGSVAHQEVVFGAPGETLTIRHDCLDRAAFMPGVLLAVKKVGATPGLTVGLEHLLDL
ncbi:MAG: 4-hydroxy-tetrahydrodipicolinate reductase [Actinomycetota bacterium]